MAASMLNDPEGDNLDEEAPVATDLERVLAKRTPRRRKALTVALIVGALGVLAANIWRTVGQPVAGGALPALPATVVAEIESDVVGATVTVNGKPYQGAYTLHVKLARGTYTIALRDDPLPPLACRVSWPPDPDHDTCRDSNGQSSFDPSDSTHLHVALLLRASDFPAAARAAILSAIPQGLAALSDPLQAIVPAGQHYGGSLVGRRVPLAQVAATPLGASLRVTLDSGPCAEPQCVVPTPIYSAVGDRLEWVVAVPVRLAWWFASTSGAPVEDLIFPQSQLLTLGLLPQSDGAWLVDTGFISPEALSIYAQIARYQCGIGFGLARSVIVPYESPRSPATPPATSEISPARIAQGCLIQVGTSSGAAKFLFRFGALLAADSLAHSVAPTLRVASAQEVAAATPGA